MPVKTLEFYSGIGGMHLALQRTRLNAHVLAAFDWDQSACRAYSLNFPHTSINQIDICSLLASEVASYNADLWLLSPSCQPYTVLNPLAKDDADPRARPFLHLVHTILPKLSAQGSLPRYLLIENVAGFETSSTRLSLLSRLSSLGYLVLELLLTPLQFGIPNSRLRYYLLAKLPPLTFSHVSLSSLNADKLWRHIPGHGTDWLDPRFSEAQCNPQGQEIRQYLDDADAAEFEFAIPHQVLEKWGRLFDIVFPSSRRSCCFTRGYTKRVEGTGSILQMNEELKTNEIFDKFLRAQSQDDQLAVNTLGSLQLRYFSPAELLCLFGFQQRGAEPFKWPATMSMKTKYRLIGNSINVDVVEHLINYLFQ